MSFQEYAWLGLDGPTTEEPQGKTLVQLAEDKYGERIDHDRIFQGELEVIDGKLWVPLLNGGLGSLILKGTNQ